MFQTIVSVTQLRVQDKMVNDLTVKIGIVVIGRNEGDRLKRCLGASLSQAGKIVYVDSGSSDGSVAYARSRGVDVLQLNSEIPFSAGRARNEGFRQLVRTQQGMEFVQFVDGDCELNKDWASFAANFLAREVGCAVVAGRRSERYPISSIYNMLCDVEWNTPVGEVKQCGGDFMIRRKAFECVNGFNPDLVAGEEPELCYRLRRNNWSIFRVDRAMTVHDANITRFCQWWKRQLRCGYSYAHVFSLHKRQKELHFLRNVVSTWFWAVILPCAIAILAVAVNGRALFLLGIYPMHLLKIAVTAKKRAGNWRRSLIYALFIVIGRWPLLIGQLLFLKRRSSDKERAIIEYK